MPLRPTTSPRPVAIIVYPDVQSLDVSGPVEVFSAANNAGAVPAYDLTVLSSGDRHVRSASGLHLVADGTIADHDDPVDTLVVAGGPGTAAALTDTALHDWLRTAAGRTRRVTSVCSGAMILAAAGLLDGRRATTHWSVCELMGRLYPGVEVEQDRIFVRDEHVWTSAGVTAGMDLALALVEDDHGSEIALAVARQLVLFTQRPGGQSQFSTHLAARPTDREPLRAVLAHIADHLDDDLSVPALARRAAMSPRTFARTFRAELGTTPAAFVRASRVEAARRLLESTAVGTSEVARRCGFGTVETMHRAFRRTVNTTPAAYRRHFSSPAPRPTALSA
ncbi:MAG TPA: GlxA family transcriptional regulator [Acidimicrobiales bacterium]|nr:GlxA family transcriptional regulator [Acidimicrobiales bacterium]